jgi:hypothetical protein
VYPKTSFDEYGSEVLGSAVSYSARVQFVSKTRMLPNGDVTIINAIAYIAGDVSINQNDKLTYNGVNYVVSGKSNAVDGQGNVNHTKLELQKANI